MSTGSKPRALGAGLVAADSDALALLSTDGLTEGTKAFNVALDAYFELTTSTDDPVTDQIVLADGLSNGRWVAVPVFTSIEQLADELATATNPLVQTYITDVVDLAQTHAGGSIVMLPARPGFFPMTVTQRAIIVSKGGTLSTQPTFSMGADASYIDFMASTAVGFTVGFPAGVGASVGFAVQASPVATYSHTTPIYLKQTVAAAGSGLVLTVRFVFSMMWIPAFS